MLEMRQMIEQACSLIAEVSCLDGANLTIRLGQGQSLDEGVTLNGVPLQSLNSCRDLVHLVGQLHALRDSRPARIGSIA